MVDQIAGRVDMQVSNAMGALQQVKEGKLLALAVTSPERFEQLPDVPTMAQAGVADFEASEGVSPLAGAVAAGKTRVLNPPASWRGICTDSSFCSGLGSLSSTIGSTMTTRSTSATAPINRRRARFFTNSAS